MTLWKSLAYVQYWSLLADIMMIILTVLCHLSPFPHCAVFSLVFSLKTLLFSRRSTITRITSSQKPLTKRHTPTFLKTATYYYYSTSFIKETYVFKILNLFLSFVPSSAEYFSTMCTTLCYGAPESHAGD